MKEVEENGTKPAEKIEIFFCKVEEKFLLYFNLINIIKLSFRFS